MQATSGKTVIVFLIDGLAVSTLQRGLEDRKIPEMSQYFFRNKKQAYLARTTFPSLTFPAIGSLLTEKPIEQNGLYGNQIYYKDMKIDFESPRHLANLRDIVRGKNIFSRLHSKGLKSVSIDYAFTADSDAHMDLDDFETALDIKHKRYDKVDGKLIHSLKNLLDATDPKAWPDFIFVHLVGIDFMSHDHGPNSVKVQNYLQDLDGKLKGVFDTLTKAELTKKRVIVALLTSDHGYDVRITKNVNLVQTLKRIDPLISVLNEGRYLGISFPSYWHESRKSELLKDLVSDSDIDIVALRTKSSALVQSKKLATSIYFLPANCRQSLFAIAVVPGSIGVMQASGVLPVCPENLDFQTNQMFYPYFMSNISNYFMSPGHPEAVIIARPGVSFKANKYLGQHGGPTPQETIVPLLMRNAVLENPNQIPPLWEILRFL